MYLLLVILFKFQNFSLDWQWTRITFYKCPSLINTVVCVFERMIYTQSQIYLTLLNSANSV